MQHQADIGDDCLHQADLLAAAKAYQAHMEEARQAKAKAEFEAAAAAAAAAEAKYCNMEEKPPGGLIKDSRGGQSRRKKSGWALLEGPTNSANAGLVRRW
jgi:hypothetical protein